MSPVVDAVSGDRAAATGLAIVDNATAAAIAVARSMPSCFRRCELDGDVSARSHPCYLPVCH